MKKPIWIEFAEWCVLAVVALFLTGVFAMREEITLIPGADSAAPLYSLQE